MREEEREEECGTWQQDIWPLLLGWPRDERQKGSSLSSFPKWVPCMGTRLDAATHATRQKEEPIMGLGSHLGTRLEIVLRGKRLGILRKDFFRFPSGSVQERAFAEHFDIMSKMGAILVDNLEIPSMNVVNDPKQSGERALMLAEFKLSLNSYLSELATSPVRSLSDIIEFNNKHPVEERMAEFGQDYLLQSEATNGIGPTEERAIAKLNKLCKKGLEKIVQDNQLDAIVAPGASAHSLLAIGGYPAITVPAGYAANGVPFAICFGGLKGSEPKLIEIAYSFEQATKVRKPPSLQHCVI